MNALNSSKAALLAALMMGASLGMTACQKEQTPVEKASDAVGDALNVRDHEKLKDAAEDAKSAASDAAQGVKDEVKKATDK